MNEATHLPPVKSVEAPLIKEKSKGEKAFDKVVYGGFAGVGTFVLTLPVAFKIKHGRWAEGYGKLINMTEKGLSRFLPAGVSSKVAEQVVETTVLMQGGNLMLLPIRWAERRKVSIVNGLNRLLGDPTPPEDVAQAPQQTWGSLVAGRALAFLTVFGTFFSASVFLPRSFSVFKAEFGERTHQLVGWFKRVRSSPVMEQTRGFKIGELAALDVFATMAAASVLYVGAHFFARKRVEKQEKRAHREVVVAAPAIEEKHPDAPLDERPALTLQGDKRVAGTVAPNAELAII